MQFAKSGRARVARQLGTSLEVLEPRRLLSSTSSTKIDLSNLASSFEKSSIVLTPNSTSVTKSSGKATTISGSPIKTGDGLTASPQDTVPQIITWVNRATTTAGGTGDTDGFGATFGTMAPVARAVVDAVIVSYERMIISFNYPTNITYSLTVSMSGSGFGASAGYSAVSGSGLTAKPSAGTINMGKGNATTLGAGAGSDQGWFLDPTPFDNSEFEGNITNAFSGDAPAGSPANGKGDFFTVVAAELTHCMGQFGSSFSGWSRYTTNTGANDADATGKLWTFVGPSVSHLMTSDNGGSQDFGSAIHTADPQTLTYNGVTYLGGQDQGNALYEFSRRYNIDWVASLEFKDAYGYSSIKPDVFGTYYSVLNQTTGNVLVRGGDSSSGHSSSNDNIKVTRTGNIVTVSNDIGNDVGGTGPLAGNGNLPAWTTNYDISTIQSITITAGDGDDAITIGSNLGVPVTIDGGSGTNTLTLQGTTTDDTINVNSSSIAGNAYNITSFSNLATLNVLTGNGTDTINFINAGAATVSFTGGTGFDTFNVTTSSGTQPLITAGSGPTVINVTGSYTVATDLGLGKNVTVNANGGTVTFTTSEHLTALNASNGGRAIFTVGGNKVLVVGNLNIDETSTVDLYDNDAIDTGDSLATVESLISSARNGGTFNGGGLTSTTARTNSKHNTTFGAMTDTEYDSIYGASATFDTLAVPTSSVVIKYTYYGDADFSGKVDANDYGHIDSGYQNQNTPGFVADWFNGDFNYDGLIDANDYALIDGAYQTQTNLL